MKRLLVLAALTLLLPYLAIAKPTAAPASGNIRTIANLPNFPLDTFRRSISGQLYKSLRISPVTAWVIARAAVQGSHTVSARIVQSDAAGTFDKMAMKMAEDVSVSGSNTTESRSRTDYVTSHLLIYKIADGAMAISFQVNDDPRYSEYQFYAPAWVGVWKAGKWTTISAKPRPRSDSYPQPPGI